jgi:hypothetical protein
VGAAIGDRADLERQRVAAADGGARHTVERVRGAVPGGEDDAVVEATEEEGHFTSTAEFRAAAKRLATAALAGALRWVVDDDWRPMSAHRQGCRGRQRFYAAPDGFAAPIKDWRLVGLVPGRQTMAWTCRRSSGGQVGLEARAAPDTDGVGAAASKNHRSRTGFPRASPWTIEDL